MDNVVLTSACQISPESGVPLNIQLNPPTATTEPEATPEPITEPSCVENPTESAPSVEQTEVDGNFQARMDINYQAHDVALASAKTNGHEPEHTNGFKSEPPHQKLDMDDGSDHPDKVKPWWSMLNKLFLVMAIVCFALFLGAMALFISDRVSLLKTFLFV